VHSIISGCVPVLLSDHTVYPFSLLEYAVQVPEADIALLPELLHRIGTTTLHRMRRALRRVWTQWVYTSVYNNKPSALDAILAHLFTSTKST
jgi:hypothetical protein